MSFLSKFSRYNKTNLKLLNFHKRNIFVQIDKTPNELSLKFIPTGHKILSDPNNVLDIGSYKESLKKSPLARELLVIDGVKNVFLTHEYVTVTVDDQQRWPDVQGDIVAVINDYLLQGKAILESDFEIDDFIDYDDEEDEVVAIIRELLDTRIRPNVQYDGGDVIYRGFDHETGIVSLELFGACKGCSQSQATLHDGIERMLKYYIPEVSGIYEVISEDTLKLQQINQEVFDKIDESIKNDSKR